VHALESEINVLMRHGPRLPRFPCEQRVVTARDWPGLGTALRDVELYQRGRSEVVGFEAGLLGDASKHLWAKLLVVVEGEDDVREAFS